MNEPRSICSASTGRARVEVTLVNGLSTATDGYSSSPFRLLVPRWRGQSVWAYTSSFGGGLLAGDQTELDVHVGEGARCFLTSQAVTKVYRNPLALPCGHCTKATIDKNAILVFAPDRIQPFAESSYRQDQEWRLAQGAGLVLLDWFCAGRSARGERWSFARFQSRNDVWLEGERVFVDSVLLGGGKESLGGPHRLGAFDCFAMLLLIGAPLTQIAATLFKEVAALPADRSTKLICTASPVQQGVVIRIAALNSEEVSQQLEHYFRPLWEILGDDPWVRKW